MHYKKVDINDLFITENNNSSNISKNEIDTIVNYIKTKNGGKGKKNISYHLHKADTKHKSIKSKYDLIVIDGRGCAILNLLGEGAFGKVYRAVDLTNGKLVAIKCQPCHLKDIILKQTKITKENGIGLHDPQANFGPTFLDDGYGYFILPLADYSYHRWICMQKGKPGGDGNILDALIKISHDLESLHDKKKVHMDLKSDNVLIIENRAYISDFGKAEKEGDLIHVAKADYRQYSQCAPEYFSNVNSSLFYKVSSTFDYFSFGYLIKSSIFCFTNRDLRQELENISSELSAFNPMQRINLIKARKYLTSLKNKYKL